MRIIFFDIDCFRPDHLGCYGYERPTSPTIDSIAKEGMIFDHYYCASSPCLPSRSAWASGRFGFNNGVVSNYMAGAEFKIQNLLYQGPAPQNEMFMRQLRRFGYDTISFSNFADRHNAWHFMVGWSEYHTPNLKGGAETAEEVNEPLLHWLKYNATKENYFLHVNYWDTHRPYGMEASWADRFRDYPVRQPWPDKNTIDEHQNITGFFTATGQFRGGKSPHPLMPGSISSRADFEHMITGYDASIAYVDHHISVVLDELRRQDVFDDAVIIISGDHGDAFGEHGIYSDHICADECIHRVPCIICTPGISAEGGQCSSLLYNVDFAPTICDMLGFPTPERWDGDSFLDNLKGREGLEREYLVWDHALYTVQRAVRTRDHLMVRTYDNSGYHQFEPLELYNITEDPFQTNNIAQIEPELVAKCDRNMNDWIQKQLNKDNVICDPLNKVIEERKSIPDFRDYFFKKWRGQVETIKRQEQLQAEYSSK